MARDLLEAGIGCWRSPDFVLMSLPTLLRLEPVSRRVLFRGLIRGSERTEGESRLGSGEAGERSAEAAGSSLASKGRNKDSPSLRSFFSESPLDFFPLIFGELELVLSLVGLGDGLGWGRG